MLKTSFLKSRDRGESNTCTWDAENVVWFCTSDSVPLHNDDAVSVHSLLRTEHQRQSCLPLDNR